MATLGTFSGSSGWWLCCLLFMVAIHPHKNVLRFEPNYPQRNPNTSRTISIAGTIPQNLQIKFLAYYAASQSYESCYRSMPLTPGFPLHLVESPDVVRLGSAYKISVTVDKYLPGECGWSLDFVGYQLLDEGRDIVEERFERGGRNNRIFFSTRQPTFGRYFAQ
jgi:hypothetical protein